MGAIGAVGGIGGGLGSVGGSSPTAYDAAPLMAPDPTSSFTQNWYSAESVMETGGEIDGTTVHLEDNDLTAAGVGHLKEEEQRVQPMIGADTPRVPAGVGSSPSAEVVGRVASIYAQARMS